MVDIRKSTMDEGLEQAKKAGRARQVLMAPLSVLKRPASWVVSGAVGIKNRVTSTSERIKNSGVIMRANMADPDIEAMEFSFELVMMKWGLQEEQVPRVAQHYLNHVIGGVFGLVLCFVYAFFIESWFAFLSVTLFSVAILFLMLASFWRYKVLTTRQFVPFFKWLIRD